MYIYADESGHSGKMIFNDPPFYYQGAIFSVEDIEPNLREVVDKWCAVLGCDRLHAYEIGDTAVVCEICSEFINALGSNTWAFHLTKVEKQYLVATKFVDTFFDSFENPAVPYLWYNHDLFRHTLCCLFDDALTDRSKRAFWDAYLTEDWSSLKAVIRNVKTYLPRYAKDRRLFNVALDSLNFALAYPDEITILTRGRNKYKPHTPNMVGFNSLLLAVRGFSKEHKVRPEAFYHDRQSEFGHTMKEYHRIFGGIELLENKHGFPPTAEKAEFDLGQLALPSSYDVAALQAVDFFIWIFQRDGSGPILDAREKLEKYVDDTFHVTRSMSELIRRDSLMKTFSNDITPENEVAGKKLLEKMEQRRTAGIAEVQNRSRVS